MPLKQEGLDSKPWRAKETEAQVNMCSLKIFLLLSKKEGKKHKGLWNYNRFVFISNLPYDRSISRSTSILSSHSLLLSICLHHTALSNNRRLEKNA
jgi:hypothetical protein